MELPLELLRAAKARAAERGEALKTLFTRAVKVELGGSAYTGRDQPAEWPLIASRRKGTVRLTTDDRARIAAGGDAADVGVASRRRR